MAASPASAASLALLVLAHFPPTTDGRLARGICGAWARLRTQYASRVTAGSPDQLGQWFSGPDWAVAYSDAGKLGNDPAYSHLETAYGVATTGDTASVPNARLLNRACSAGR